MKLPVIVMNWQYLGLLGKANKKITHLPHMKRIKGNIILDDTSRTIKLQEYEVVNEEGGILLNSDPSPCIEHQWSLALSCQTGAKLFFSTFAHDSPFSTNAEICFSLISSKNKHNHKSLPYVSCSSMPAPEAALTLAPKTHFCSFQSSLPIRFLCPREKRQTVTPTGWPENCPCSSVQCNIITPSLD